MYLPGVAALEPPITAKPRGRPAVLGKRKGDMERAGAAQLNVVGELPDVPKCSVCKETGHHTPRCHKAHC